MLPVLLTTLLPVLTNVLDRVIPDPQQKAKALQDLITQLQQSDLAQMDVNKAEASSSSMFVAGWRPFIGWVCGFAVAYNLVLLPLAGFIASFFGEQYVTMVLNAPKLDDNLWMLLGSMLGIGGLRTIEKLKGVAAR